MSTPLAGPVTRAQALAIARANIDRAEFDLLTSSPDGLALAYMLADIVADQSARMDRSLSARHLRARRSDVNPIAGGAVAAVAPVSSSRSRLNFPISIPAGSRVATPDGHEFALDAALDFAAGSAGPATTNATAVVPGYASTCLAGSIDRSVPVANGASGDLATVNAFPAYAILHREAGDRFLPTFQGLLVEFVDGTNAGALARIVSWLSADEVQIVAVTPDPLSSELTSATWAIRDWSELGVSISQPGDSSQGVDGELDGLALDVGRYRQESETDASLRAALLYLPDVVTVRAVLRACNRVVGSLGPVVMYEAGTCASEAVAAAGLYPAPGPVCDLSPCDVGPEDTFSPGALTPASTPAGLSALLPERFFLLKWAGPGAGDPGGHPSESTGLEVDDDGGPLGLPMSAAADVSPCDGAAFDDDGMRAAIWAVVERVRAAGVRWGFYPRFWTAT